MQQQKRKLEVKIERERNALTKLSKLAATILDYVRNHGRVTMRDMVREPQHTKMTFGGLVDKELLIHHDADRGT